MSSYAFASPSQLRAEKARRRLSAFFQMSWPIIEQTAQLEWNWHHEVICDHVQSALEDWMRAQSDETYTQRIKNLLINVPPGTAKSRIVSVCAPAWMWLRYPSWRVLCLSTSDVVALRDSLFCRDIILSPWYQNSFAPDWSLRPDQNAKGSYWNTRGGIRRAFGIMSRITGDRADAIIIDDPHDADEAQSDPMRNAVLNKYDGAIANRVNSPRTSLRMGVCQRVHHKDWSGHVLGKGGWTHLCIEQEFEPARRKAAPNPGKHELPLTTPLGWSDPRQQIGELMHPARYPPAVLAEEKNTMGATRYSGQHQQRPSPMGGSIWKRFWWGYWVPAGMELPPVTVPMSDGSSFACRQITLPARFEFTAQSWDMAFSGGETSSMVVGQVWGLQGVERFLLDQLRAQMDFSETQRAFRALCALWPGVETKLVENKANGPAIISSLRGEFSGIVAVEPEGDKVARALAEQTTIESGHVWLPHPHLYEPHVLAEVERFQPTLAHVLRAARGRQSERTSTQTVPTNWVEDFVEESASFPNGAFKDVVDTASQALNRVRKFIAQRDRHRDTDEGEISTSWNNAR